MKPPTSPRPSSPRVQIKIRSAIGLTPIHRLAPLSTRQSRRARARTARHPIHRWAQSARTLQTSRTHHVLQPALFLLARPSVDRVHHQPACERPSSSLTHRLGTATLPTPRHYRSCYPPRSVSRLIRTEAGAGRESEPVLVTLLTKRPRQSAGAHSVTLSPVTSTASSGISPECAVTTAPPTSGGAETSD